MRRYLFLGVVFGLAIVMTAAAANYFLLRPSVLRVSVAQGTDDHKLVDAIARVLSASRGRERLNVVPVNSAAASAAALQAGAVDLAVVRSDIALPVNGQTLAILHHNPALLITTADHGLRSVVDLRGKTVGIVRATSAGNGNAALFDQILAQYDIAPDAVAHVVLERRELAASLKSGQVDALFIVAPTTSDALADAVAAAAQGAGGVAFIPVSEAKAMAQRSKVLESTEIVRGAFGGDPPRPSEAFETVGVTARLVARASLRDTTASDLTRVLFSERLAIAQLHRLANQIEAPSTDKDSALPVHPGAAAYLDDEEQTFFDKYSDFIYIGAMLLSIAGSGAAAFFGRMTAVSHNQFDRLLERLLEILAAARTTIDPDDLDRLEKEADEILVSGIANRRIATVDQHGMAALALALDQAREAIREQRRAITRAQAPPGPRRIASGD